MSVTFFPDAHEYRGEVELNVSNDNAFIPILMMGLRQDDFDAHSLSCEDMPEALIRLSMLTEDAYIRSPSVYGPIIDCGVSVHQVQRYRDRLIQLLAYCIKHKTNLVWG